MPHLSQDLLLFRAGPGSDPKSPWRDLVKVRMEMTHWSDREARTNLKRPPSKFNLLGKRCKIKDISRGRATQEIQMEYIF